MAIVETLKRQSLKQLFKLFVRNASLRSHAVALIEDQAYQAIVVDNRDGLPHGAAVDRYRNLVGLLHGFDRNLRQGIISQRVVEVMLHTLAENVVLNRANQDSLIEALGFCPPEFLGISPTKRCNLRCTGCYAGSLPNTRESLPYGVVDRILTEMQTLWRAHFVAITGGEPLAWRDEGKGILEVVEAHPDQVFMMYTNGTLIDEEVARRLGQLGNLTPAISVEGYEAETDARRGVGTYRKVMRAIELLRKHGVVFGISTVPTRENWRMLVNEQFLDQYVFELGALYIWLFQYMPHGRDSSFDLMVPPEERVEMLREMRRFIFERQAFMLDFWNSGPITRGCIAAGRRGGYFNIDWNGGVSPCVFVPYTTANIVEIYERGGTLNDAYHAPFLRRVREWQDEKGWDPKRHAVGNWLTPCPMRDHFASIKRAALESGAVPMNPTAATSLTDPQYESAMVEYGNRVKELVDPIWETEYVRSSGTSPTARRA